MIVTNNVSKLEIIPLLHLLLAFNICFMLACLLAMPEQNTDLDTGFEMVVVHRWIERIKGLLDLC